MLKLLRKFLRLAAPLGKLNLVEVFMQTPHLICLFRGPKYRFEMANRTCYRLIHFNPIVGKPFEKVLPQFASPSRLENLKHVYSSGKPFEEREVKFLFRSNNESSAEEHYFNIFFLSTRNFLGRASGVLLYGVDVTEQIQMRKTIQTREVELKRTRHALLEAMSARDEFLSIAAHELKTPLSSLHLQAQGMKRSIQRDDSRVYSRDSMRKLVYQTDRQVTRLERLIDDMLDISKIQSGHLTIQPEVFDLKTLLIEAIEWIQSHPQRQSSRIHLTDIEPLEGSWDYLRLQQVILHLLTNAIRYGRGSPITVRMERKNEKVYLSIKDQGIGIAPKDQPRIFKQFERAISVNEVSGLGLGLFIAQQIIEGHGGKIWVESQIGQGSTFFIELPIHTQPSVFNKLRYAV